MDDTTQSVYLTGGKVGAEAKHWLAYPEKEKNGGRCTGWPLGFVPDGCINLNRQFPGKRIRCLVSEKKLLPWTV